MGGAQDQPISSGDLSLHDGDDFSAGGRNETLSNNCQSEHENKNASLCLSLFIPFLNPISIYIYILVSLGKVGHEDQAGRGISCPSLSEGGRGSGSKKLPRVRAGRALVPGVEAMLLGWRPSLLGWRPSLLG